MYSIVLLPLTPAVVVLTSVSCFGSKVSKSFGKTTSGFLISLIFPLPEIFTLIVTASFVFTLLELISDVMVKLPTAPENDAGLPEGNGFTSIVAGLDTNAFRTLSYMSSKLSKMLLIFRWVGILIIASNLPLSIVSFPERCG